MKHYHALIAISPEELETIRKEFQDYMERAGGFTIIVRSDNAEEPSQDLVEVLHKLFTRLLVTLDSGQIRPVTVERTH